jgi:hypothetical protein
MPEADRSGGRALAWLTSRGPELIEADGVLVALAATHLWVCPLPAPAVFAALAVALVWPGGGRPLPTDWRRYARGLPYRLAVMAVVGALWHYAFSLPLASLAFSPLWLAGGAAWVVAHQAPVPASIRIARTVGEWSRRQRERAFAVQADLGLADLAVWATGFYFAACFLPGFWPHPWLPAALLGAWGVGRGLMGWHRLAPSAGADAIRVLISAAVLGFLTAAARSAGGTPSLRAEFAVFFWGAVASLAVRLGARTRERRWGDRAPELMRWVLVGAAGLWLLRGLGRYALHGSDDALWYATMLADVVTQLRAGIFPFWSGQSIYQFNGAIYPLRVAPGFLYLGALLDALTFRSLGVFALQNLLLTLVGIGTIFSAYFCLAALLPSRRGLAAGLAILFLGCPGVLGVAYNSDLYMSWTTLPWIPIIWFATVRSFRDRGAPGTLFLLGAALGLGWWGHSPIALWSTLVAGLIQGVRLAGQGLRPGEVWAWMGSAAAFLAIAGYPIGSVLLYPPQAGIKMGDFQRATAGTIAYFVDSAFPGILRPLSHNGRSLSDFQLGYALWLILAGCTWHLRRMRRPEILLPVVVAWALIVLLLPIPVVNLKLWAVIPAFIRNTTGNWAMNRLYLLLAAAVAFGAAAAFASVTDTDRKPRRWLWALLWLGCAWNVRDDAAFVQGSIEGAHPPSSAANQLRPENVKISRFAYMVFPKWPVWFNHGVVDPAMENRLRDRSSFAVIASNAGAAQAAGREVASGQFRRLNVPASYSEFDRTLRLEPGRRYLLDFDYLKPEVSGVLQIEGPHFFREYGVPEYGGDASFGAGGAHSQVISVWTSGAEAEDLRLRYVSPPTPADPQRSPTFARVRLLEFNPAALPVRVTSWMPYRAEVTSPVSAWVETPRVYLDGYVATVNAQPAAVARSPEGLASVAVPAGSSSIQLVYRPPVGLVALFWVSLTGIAAALVLAARLLVPSSSPSIAS